MYNQSEELIKVIYLNYRDFLSANINQMPQLQLEEFPPKLKSSRTILLLTLFLVLLLYVFNIYRVTHPWNYI